MQLASGIEFAEGIEINQAADLHRYMQIRIFYFFIQKICVNPWPRPLAQTWHARISYKK